MKTDTGASDCTAQRVTKTQSRSERSDAPGRIHRIQHMVGLCLLLATPLNTLPAEAELAPPSIEGTWRWTFTMPDGSTVRPKLKLRARDGRLAGTTSYRAGTEASITNLTVQGSRVRFQVVRQRDGQDIVTTYVGGWTNDTIVGRIESNWAGAPESFPWRAERTSLGLDGTWRWTNSFAQSSGRGRTNETRVELEQHGARITGRTVGRSSVPIRHGTVTNGLIAFEIERTFGDRKIVTYFEGRPAGDTILGTMSVDRDGDGETDSDDEEFDWVARRTD